MGGVMVTGATGGIGSALVAELHDQGREVIALGRDAEALDALAARHRGVRGIAADLRAPGLLREAVSGIGRLDGLIHNAGVAPVATVADTSYEQWQETLTVNIVAAAELTRLLLPALRATAGHVVFINAAPGVRAVPSWSAYAASKAALRELADSLRKEEAGNGLRVTSVYPGGTATGLLARVRAQFGQPYDPGDCISPRALAAIVVDALDGPGDECLVVRRPD